MYIYMLQAAQKEAQQQDGKKQRKKAGKRAAESMDTSKQKSPQQQQQQKVGDKRKRVRKAHVFLTMMEMRKKMCPVLLTRDKKVCFDPLSHKVGVKISEVS